MAVYEHLPIFKGMMDLTVLMEGIVQHFSRYHKYSLGGELRAMCHDALALIMEANSTQERRPVLLKLRIQLERIKIHLMISREVQAFNNKNSFSQATEKVVDLCRQNEGWIRSTAAGKSRG